MMRWKMKYWMERRVISIKQYDVMELFCII